MRENEVSERVIGAAIEVHRALGPGLPEGVYEEALCHELHLRGMAYERQKAVPIACKDVKLSTDLRLDLIVEGVVIVDVKAKEEMSKKDHAKTLTYLRPTGVRLGLNINFHEPLLVDGIKRIVNSLI